MPGAAVLAANLPSAAAVETAIVLETCNPKPRQAMAIDQTLPRQEFLDRERIALTGFLEAEHASAYGSDDLGLASDHPTLGFRRRKLVERDTGADFDEPVVIALGNGRLSAIGHWL